MTLKKIILLLTATVLISCSALEGFLPDWGDPNGVDPVCPTCPAPEIPECPTCEPCPPTATELPPTATFTPESSATPTETATGVPGATSTPTPPQAITATATRTFTPTAATMPYALQPNSPVYTQNFVHSDKGCNWMGVGGQVFNRTGNPVVGLVVVVEGFLGQRVVDELMLTGLSTPYGPGGYEIVLDNKTVASSNSLFITLFDLAGTPLTNPIPFETFNDCNKNLIVINFKQR